MRTKTLLLSTLLGAISTVALHAQSVYSLNAVGYINVTLEPGFNIVSCPLITSPDNTIGTVLNNASGALTGSQVYFWSPSTGYTEDTAKNVGPGKTQTTNADGWANGGTLVAAPGVGFWVDNTATSNITVTFVGTVPSGPMTNTLVAGFNLVGSVVPVSGDIVSNTISAFTNYNIGDSVYVYSSTSGYSEFTSATGKPAGHGYLGQWTSAGDPIVPNVGQGFWYDNKVGTTVDWVENYSVSQ